MTTTAVARVAPVAPAASQAVSFDEMERLADSVARCGLFGIKTKEQAIVLMAISQAEGRHPALAARDYDIIQNRPAKKSEAMMRDFMASGGKVEWHQLDDACADATFSHPQGGSARITWDMERAKAAGLTGKDMYRKFPRQMLRSRVVSEGVRTVCPMATSGMYVPEEVADFDTPRAAPAPSPGVAKPLPAPAPVEAAPPVLPHIIAVPSLPDGGQDWLAWGRALIAALKAAQTADDGEAWVVHNAAIMTRCADHAPKAHGSIVKAIAAMRERLGAPMPEGEWLGADDAPNYTMAG